jgi:Arc/MetJ-type ribon-helix-helix transcriptional regulator
MAGDRVRTTITLPAELDKRLRESVPQRKRSEFIAEAVDALLRHAEKQEAWDQAAGICKADDYPHWRTPADVRRYIDESRSSENWRRPTPDAG